MSHIGEIWILRSIFSFEVVQILIPAFGDQSVRILVAGPEPCAIPHARKDAAF